MLRILRIGASASLALLVLFLAAPGARAEVSAKTGDIEIFTGWYWPEGGSGSDPSDAVTYGIRGGYNFTSHFGMQGSVQGINTDLDNPTPLADTDIESVFTDLSFEWLVNPDDRAVFEVFGGPGYSWTSIDPPVGKTDDDNVFTMHFGIGAKITAANNFYIRPDARVRWFSDDENGAGTSDDGHTDWEISLGIGWYLGGQ
jgi:OOP family OmpA-OmpF porin